MMVTVYLYVYLSISFLILVINLCEIKKFAKISPVPLKFIPLLVIFVVITPLAFLSLPLFVLYQKMVALLLRIKHGANFLGHFTDIDALHARSKFGKCVINFLLVVECEKDEHKEKVFETISELIDNVVIKNCNKLPKFCSTLQNFLGYAYMLKKENVTVSDCVKTLKIKNASCKEISKEQLMEIINEHSSDRFICPNALMWDVHVGMQPVQWKTNENKKYYPILFRFHHGIADGINLSKFLSGVCSDNLDNEATRENITRKVPIPVPLQKQFLQLIKLIAHWSTVYLFFPTMNYVFLFIKNQNFDKFTRYSTFNKRTQVDIAVDDTDKYLMKVKEIVRKHRGGASFTSVITAAFAGSLRNYYLKKNRSCPKYLTTLQIMNPAALSLLELQPGSLKIDEIQFRNEHNWQHTLIPIMPEKYNEESLISRLDDIIDNLKFDKNSIMQKVAHQYLLTFCAFAPYPIPEMISTFTQFGASISNIPGTRKITLGNNRLTVCDYMAFVTKLESFPATLTITTYDRRLVCCICIQSSLLSDPNDLQDILGNMYEQIDILEEEVNTAASCL